MAQTLAVAHWGSPYISAYPWSGGFGAKYSDPGVAIPFAGQGVTFSPDGTVIAVAHYSSPYVSVYPWRSGFGAKYSDPGTTPTHIGYGVAFSPNGASIAVAHSSSPYVSAYPWSSGFGTKYSDPGTLPTGIGYSVAISSDSAAIAVAHATSPYVSAYPWNPGFGTKYSDASTLPTGTGKGVAFSPSGSDIAVSHDTSPFITAYPWSAGFGTKYANPGTLPASNAWGVAFSFGGDVIAVAHASSPFITAYPWSAGFGTKYANPGTLPTSNGYGVSFSPGDDNVALSVSPTPYIFAYPWNDTTGFGSKYSNPGTLPTGQAFGASFRFTPVASGEHDYPRSISTSVSTSPYDDLAWALPANIAGDDAAYASIIGSSDQSSGPLSPASRTSSLSAPYDDVDWTNPGNIAADDTSYATIGSASTSAGPRAPTANSTSSAVSPYTNNNWFSPGSVYIDDTTYASVTSSTYDTNKYTFQLKASGYGFSIPTTATILGVEAKVIRYCGAGSAVDGLVSLTDSSNALFGNNKADTVTSWPGSMTEATYGGATDMWGLTTAQLTPSVVNSSNFGLSLSAKATADNTDVYVDYMSLKVFYVDTTFNLNEYSYLIKAQNFGFIIPPAVTILGIEAKIIKSCEYGTAIDGLVQLLDSSGALFGSSLASGTNWSGSMTESTYGGATNMWGLNTSTLTPAVINDVDFGIALSAKATSDLASIAVDHVSLKVFYEYPSGYLSEYSYLLKAQDFGFTIPSTAAIAGIEVKVERKSSAGTIKDAIVQLIGPAGTLIGTDKADTATAWPASDTVKTYGSSSDLWGTTLTYADVNDADFGVSISVKSEAALSSAFVDYITLAVTWSDGTLKTAQGVARANIKTIQGLIFSSVKTFQGLT